MHAPTPAANSDLQGSNKPGTALLRVNRYRAEEVPKQLQLMAALAAPRDASSPPQLFLFPQTIHR